MSLYQHNVTWNTSSALILSAFIAAAQSCADCFTNLGWVQTADTGQVTISAITPVPTVNTSGGYHIYRSNDSLTGTTPIYVKVDFWRGNNYGFTPKITVGFATDGAGNITGSAVGPTIMGSNSVNTTSAKGWASGNSGRMTMCYATDVAQEFLVLNIERLRNSSGTEVADGIHVLMLVNTTTYFSQTLYPTGNNLYSSSRPGLVMPDSGTSAADGTDIYVFPIFPVGRGVHNQLIGVMGYYNSDLTNNIEVTLAPYSSSAAYWPCGIAAAYTMGVKAGVCPLVRRD